MKKEKKDKFEENACEFKNETACEEELDEEDLSLEKEDKEHFDDKGEDDEEEETECREETDEGGEE